MAAATALAMVLLGGGQAIGQAPRQTPLGGAVQTRPHDTAQAALRSGQPRRALEISETALKTFPNDAQLRFTRALALNQLNRLAEAEAAFTDLTQEYPELPEPYNNLAVVRAAQGKLDQARAALEDAIRAVPGYALAHENLGDIHAQLAARSYRRALELDSRSRTIAPKLKLVSQVGAQPASAPSTQPAPGR